MSDKHEWTLSEEQKGRAWDLVSSERDECAYEGINPHVSPQVFAYRSALRFAAEMVAQETETLAAKVRELEADLGQWSRSYHYVTMALPVDTENRARDVTNPQGLAEIDRDLLDKVMTRAETAESRVAELERLLAESDDAIKTFLSCSSHFDRYPDEPRSQYIIDYDTANALPAVVRIRGGGE